MTMHPLDIIRRDMAVAKTLADRPRRPMRQESPKTLAWMEKHLGDAFKDARAASERVKAEYEASKRKVKA